MAKKEFLLEAFFALGYYEGFFEEDVEGDGGVVSVVYASVPHAA